MNDVFWVISERRFICDSLEKPTNFVTIIYQRAMRVVLVTTEKPNKKNLGIVCHDGAFSQMQIAAKEN